MSLLIPRVQEAAHFYRPTGEPMYGGDLRDARKEGLFPGPSKILKSKVNKGLQLWWEEQIIMSAVTLPRIAGEDEDKFCQRVLQDAKAQSIKAREFGTHVHQAAEDIARSFPNRPIYSKSIPEAVLPFARLLEDWFHANVRTVLWTEKILVNVQYGYAGRADLKVIMLDGRSVLPDFKSQEVPLITPKVKAAYYKPNYYDEWAMQLSCYAHCPHGECDAVMSIVIDSKVPRSPFIKEWTAEEEEKAWGKFKALLAWWKADEEYDPLAFVAKQELEAVV